MVFFLHQTTTLPSLIQEFAVLFMVFFLHQTTTMLFRRFVFVGCLWSFSYIKPQPYAARGRRCLVVYGLFPTSNHNSHTREVGGGEVVYGLFPTSNHNCSVTYSKSGLLFMVFFLHQTTTNIIQFWLSALLFMVFFLHQTTTWRGVFPLPSRCLWSFSYIKPQPPGIDGRRRLVVYGLFPTSNHNHDVHRVVHIELFMVFFLHQTTTSSGAAWSSSRCLWSFSYIKPQPWSEGQVVVFVVYGLFPTSNHNTVTYGLAYTLLFMVFFLHQTTTLDHTLTTPPMLFMVFFLHQTTTSAPMNSTS